MEMLDATAVKAIADLSPATTFTVSDPATNRSATFSDVPLHEVLPSPDDLPSIVAVCTLDGFVELIKEKIESMNVAEFLVHVVNETTVQLIKRTSDFHGRRVVLAKATPVPTVAFKFNTWLDHETFVIQVFSQFVHTSDLDYISQVASSLTSGQTATSEDDGVSQRVMLKRGLELGKVATLKNRVHLAPFRTFPEVNQVVSEFLFRAQGGGDEAPPKLALIEADGGRWKIDAITEVRRYLENLLADKTGAANTIPIIA